MRNIAFILLLVSSLAFGQWDAKYDLDDNGVIGLGDFAMLAAHWLEEEPDAGSMDITWVAVNDPGVSGHGAFNGYISKYETTNEQYCQFLNTALASGDIVVDSVLVKGAVGTAFAGQGYYQLDGPTMAYGVDTGLANVAINYTAGAFVVTSGYENHPVTYVSWYGAMAFCNYYGWHLPTEWQWQAAADFDGTYTYGCGTVINNDIANYSGSSPLYGTTTVGSYGAFGYGIADMAGNVYEWTDSLFLPYATYVIRGGGWNSFDTACTVSVRYDDVADYYGYEIGFRACR